MRGGIQLPAWIREHGAPPLPVLYGALAAALDGYLPSPLPPPPPAVDEETRAALRARGGEAWETFLRREERYFGVRAANGHRLMLLARAWHWYSEHDGAVADRILAHAVARWGADRQAWLAGRAAHRAGRCAAPCPGCEVGT